MGKEHSELHVLTAEAAFNTEHYDIARKVIEQFIQLSPQKNQFYCRAKVLLGLIIKYECRHANGMESIKQHKLAVAEVMIALDVATDPKNIARYKFLLFNISVAFWKIVNPFLRSTRANFFTAEIGRVVSALEEQNDPDKDWRIMYLSAAAVCCDDAKDSKAATDYVDKAIEHADALLSKTLAEEDAISAELAASSAELEEIMSAFRAIEDREEALHKPKKIDPDAPPEDLNAPPEVIELPPLEGLAAEGYDKVKELLDASQERKAVSDSKLRKVVEIKQRQLETLTRLYMQRVSVNPADAKRFTGQPQVLKYPRTATLVQLQAMVSNCIPAKEWDSTFQALVKKLSEESPSPVRNETLLDICRYAWQLGQRETALRCVELAQQGNIVSRVLRLKLDVCDAIKSLADIGAESVNQAAGRRLSTKQIEGYSISKRIEAIRVLERSVGVCMNIGSDYFLVQEICHTMWNGIIPLLQQHLRLKVHSSLKTMAQALEAVASPLVQLRMTVQYELSKCEEMSDFVVIARDEGTKAILCDYGTLDGEISELDRNRYMDHIIRPYVDLLELRASVFDSPSEVEGQVQLWLQQAKESKAKQFISDMAVKSLYLMLETLQYDEENEGDGEGEGDEGNGESKRGGASQTRAGATTTDFSIMMMKKGALTIPGVELADLRQVLEMSRTEKPYSTYSRLLHTRMQIMYDIALFGHAVQNVSVLQQAGCWLLRTTWDNADPLMRGFIDMQIHVHYLIADNMLNRIKAVQLETPPSRPATSATVTATSATTGAAAVTAVETDDSLTPTEAARAARKVAAAAQVASLDPRCLGLHFADSPEELQQLKRMVVQFLDRGLQMALAARDYYAVQNGIIYFWNLHMHVFRNNLYGYAIEELFEFVKTSVAAIDALLATPPANPAVTVFDPRMRTAMLETLVGFHEERSELAEALEAAMKGAAAPPTAPAGAAAVNTSHTAVVEYNRKKLCEAASRLTVELVAAAAAWGGKGGKGGKGGGGGEPPIFENALLNVFSHVVQAEQAEDVVPREQALALTNKAVEMMDGAVAAELDALPMVDFSQERYNQLLELQVEAWTRLTRLRMLFSDTIGAQFTAEKCLALVSKSAVPTPSEEENISPRVWRWISVCERLFGNAIAAIIQPEGQDEVLQSELRLVAMQHFQLACDYGLKAAREELVVEAAVNAWNCSMPLVDVRRLRDRLYKLQRKIVNALLQCKSLSTRGAVDQLRQQFFLAIIEGYANQFDWDKVMRSVLEAFEHVSTERQKPLWQWRVIALSKKGKSVLDGMQKLKEGDPSLQAQVYGILARASSIPQQQLESYLKAIEILSESMERVDYMLETAQWMASTGIPQADIRDMVKTAMDALYEVEEQSMPEIKDLDEEEAGEILQRGGLGAVTAGTLAIAGDESVRSGSTTRQGTGSIAAASRRGGGGGAGSVAPTDASRRASTAVHASSSNQKLASVRGGAGARSRSGSVAGDSVDGTRKGSVAATSRRGSRQGSRQGTSRRGSAAGGDGAPDENVLPERLNFKMIEQATRSLVMLSMLEPQIAMKRERCVEAAYFVEKGLWLWIDQLREIHRRQAYAALSSEEREGTEDTPALDYDSFRPPAPESISPPMEPVLLLPWACRADLRAERSQLMAVALTECPLDVPSTQSVPAVSLTVHYLVQLATDLHNTGCSKFALLVYSWTRLLLESLEPLPLGAEATLAMLYFRTTRLLQELGLKDIADAVPKTVPLKPGSRPSAAEESATTTADAGAKKAGKGAAATASATTVAAANPFTGGAVEIGTFLAQFVKEQTLAALNNSGDARSASSADDASTAHESVAEFKNPFGLNTYTMQLSLKGGLDVHTYLLDVSEALLRQGQLPLCQCVARTLKNEFQRRQDARAIVQCVGLLARVDVLNGHFQDALASVLKHRVEMEAAGDAVQLAVHTEVLVQCHIHLDKPEEAKHAAALPMELLEDVAMQLIDKKAIQQQQQEQQLLQQQASSRSTMRGGSTVAPVPVKAAGATARATSSAATVRGRGSTSAAAAGSALDMMRKSSTASRMSSAGGRTSKMIVESSLTNVASLLDLCRSFYRAMMALCRADISDGEDPRPRYADLCSRLDRVQDLVADVAGADTTLTADVLSFRASACAGFLTLLHVEASQVVGVDEYLPWWRDHWALCVSYMEQAVDLRRLLAQQVPEADLTYTSPEIVAAAQESSAQGKGSSQPPYREISIPAFRTLAQAQMYLAYLLLFRAVLDGQHTTPTVFERPQERNIVEQFLEETEAPRSYEVADFAPPVLLRVGQVLAESEQLLRGACNEETKACYLRSVASVMQLCGDRQFDCMWRPRLDDSGNRVVSSADSVGSQQSLQSKVSKDSKASLAGSQVTKAEEVGGPVDILEQIGEKFLGTEVKTAREKLLQRTREVLQQDGLLLLSPATPAERAGGVSLLQCVPFACTALVEAHGSNDAAAAAIWLMQLNSVRATEWLRSLWREDALNPLSAAACSIARLELLQQSEADLPQPVDVSQSQAEYALLRSTCVPYRRYVFISR